jgi:SSS family solute:Na+ symporter
MRPIDIGIVLLYFAVVLATGLYFSRRNSTTERYFLGGRNFPGWAIGLSFIGSTISSVTFIAYPADSFKTAWVRLLPNFAYPIIVALAGLVFIPLFRSGPARSAYHYLSLRFGPSIAGYAAAIYLVAQLVRASTILYLLSILLGTLTGLSVTVCIVIAAGTTALYTVKGGFEAVVWTDVVQIIILFTGALACVVMIAFAVPGGLGQIVSEALASGKLSFQDLNPATGMLEPVGSHFSLLEKTLPMMVIVGMSQYIAGQLDQDTVQRWSSARSDAEARKSMIVLGFGALPVWGLFMFIGTCLWVYFRYFPSEVAVEILAGTRKAEDILPHFIITVLPPGLCGLVVSAALAAAMGALSSSINSSSMVWVGDIYRAHLRPGKHDAHYTKAGRWAALTFSIAMAVGAWFVAQSNARTLTDLSITLLALVGGGIAGAFLFGLLTRRGDARAVICGVVVTMAFTAYSIAAQSGFVAGRFHPYYTSILSNVTMFAVCFVASFFFRAPRRDLSRLTVWDRGGRTSGGEQAPASPQAATADARPRDHDAGAG